MAEDYGVAVDSRIRSRLWPIILAIMMVCKVYVIRVLVWVAVMVVVKVFTKLMLVLVAWCWSAS